MNGTATNERERPGPASLLTESLNVTDPPSQERPQISLVREEKWDSITAKALRTFKSYAV
jgi:hypothetical protein